MLFMVEAGGHMPGKTVADLELHQPDALGVEIQLIYGRKPPEYAVYQTVDRVMLHFADDTATAAEQRKVMAKLSPLRGEINGLIDTWRAKTATLPFMDSSTAAKKAAAAKALTTDPFKAQEPVRPSKAQRKAQCYDRRVGDALVVGFEDDIPSAELLLTTIKRDILDERISWARFEYLIVAFIAAVAAMLLIGIGTGWGHNYWPQARDLWFASAAGAAGAFFSIALAIRGRTVLPDLQRWGNIVDAVLRIIIGVMAASVLMALMLTGTVRLQIGTANLEHTNTSAWLYVLIIGFVAGFSERFVPDLLAKISASPNPQPVTQAMAPKPAATEQPVAAKAAPGAAAPVAPPAPESATDKDPLPEDAAVDHCACDIELEDHELTPDTELPVAAGGVARPETV